MKGVLGMATHNEARLIGYILNDPKILNEGKEGQEKVVFKLRTTRRKIEEYHEDQYADVIILYDGTEMMDKFKNFKKYDIVDFKGVVNILPVKKPAQCKYCGYQNIRYSASTFVYPISATRLGSYMDYLEVVGESPDALLYKNYKENSNQVSIMGTVVTDPEIVPLGKNSATCCRYGLGVDRKYYIKTQDDKKADYPWIYSFGEQAEMDSIKLIKFKSLIMVVGFIHNKTINTKIKCEKCDCEFTNKNIVTQITPYSVEYLTGYKTDEDIAREEENRRREKINQY